LERDCQRLECIGARSELARARFFAAWALYQTGREEGLDVLDQVLETADLPNRDLLFVVEGRWVLPLLELADQRRQQRNQSDGGLGWLLSRARTFDRAAREVLERAAPLEIGIGEQMIARVAAEPPVRIYGFGKGRAERGGKEIHISVWGAAATRWMLFYMLISKKRTRGQIALVLWPELAAHKVKANFHTTQFRLDRALGQDTLCYEDGAYRIHPEFDYWFDAVEFTKLVMNPDKEPERRMEQLQRAVGLYTADFLEDCYDEWAVMHREMLREQYVTALDELVRRLMARRRYRQAIKVLIKGLEIDDLRELFYRHLIRAYAMSGQRDQAIAQFQRCLQIMADELDACPSQRTTDLYSRVLSGRPLD